MGGGRGGLKRDGLCCWWLLCLFVCLFVQNKTTNKTQTSLTFAEKTFSLKKNKPSSFDLTQPAY